MFNVILILLGSIAAVLGIVFFFLNTPAAKLRKILAWLFCILGVGVGSFFLYRLNGSFLWTLLFFLIPLIMRLKNTIQQIRTFSKTAAGPSVGQSSTVHTDYLEMTLQHDSGKMTGIVTRGKFRDHHLYDLNFSQLQDLLEEVKNDPKTVQLLENFIDLNHGTEWRKAYGTNFEPQNSGEINKEQALEILGLIGNPSEIEIIEAHRRLILANHPDRGGSTFLATQINKAKEVLLQKR